MTGDYRLYERIPISEQDLELLDEPLYWAARKNNLTIVQRIIGRNRDADIMPAMMTAAASGHAEVLGFLLLNGGDRDAKYIGSSLLDVASGEKIIAVPKEREQAVIHTILSYGGPRAFRFAAERGLQDVVERILKQEPTVLNATGGCCTNTAIDLAARKGHGEIVRTLLSHYEDLPGKALISAAGRGYTKIVELFLQRGWEVNRNVFDETALFAAVYYGQEAVVRMLLDHGAYPDIECDGKTALSVAAHERRGLIKILERYSVERPRKRVKRDHSAEA